MGQLYNNMIQLIGENNQVIYQGMIHSLPLGEKLIIQKSETFFGDSDPCFLHRSAVQKRLYAELDAFVSKDNNARQISVSEMPSDILEILSGFEGITSLELIHTK